MNVCWRNQDENVKLPVVMVVWSGAGAGSSAQSAFCNVATDHQLHFNTIEPSFTATARVCLGSHNQCRAQVLSEMSPYTIPLPCIYTLYLPKLGAAHVRCLECHLGSFDKIHRHRSQQHVQEETEQSSRTILRTDGRLWQIPAAQAIRGHGDVTP